MTMLRQTLLQRLLYEFVAVNWEAGQSAVQSRVVFDRRVQIGHTGQLSGGTEEKDTFGRDGACSMNGRNVVDGNAHWGLLHLLGALHLFG